MGSGAREGMGRGGLIGLPRALLHYELYPFWKRFFEELGTPVAVSPPTSRETVEAGARLAVDEACLPVKVFYGHVMALRDRVDGIFLPRLVSLERATYTCPKLLGLPDMIRHNVGRMPRVLIVDFDETKPGKGFRESCLVLARRLGYRAAEARQAFRCGWADLESFRRRLWAGVPFDEAAGESSKSGHPAATPGRDHGLSRPRLDWRGRVWPNGHLRVGVVGHAYNLYDNSVNLDLLAKLERLGCEVLTSEMLSEDEVRAESGRLSKPIYWSSGRRILAAATRLRRERLVDGLIHLESFGCGPDSMIGEIAERETRRLSDLPYMALTIDEHTGEAGLVTRVEAFVDMLERRRRAGPADRSKPLTRPLGLTGGEESVE